VTTDADQPGRAHSGDVPSDATASPAPGEDATSWAGNASGRVQVGPSPWQVLSSEYVFRSPWRDLRIDRLRLHTGGEISYSYLEMTDAVFVVPLTTDGKIVVLRQYRHPVRAWCWEIVGGGVGPEGPAEAARRELLEEIGGTCRELVPLGSFYMGVATLTVRSHAFLALDVELGEDRREPMELLELLSLDPDEAFARARDGRIDESQSALALLMAEARVRSLLAARQPSMPGSTVQESSGSE
jgi:ADP-ribose diphosphatase